MANCPDIPKSDEVTLHATVERVDGLEVRAVVEGEMSGPHQLLGLRAVNPSALPADLQRSPKRLLKAIEAAAFLSVSRQYLYQLRNQGILAPVDLSGGRGRGSRGNPRWLLGDLERWIASGCPGCPARKRNRR
jgi:predicted DNA-binding transcriptional regulator AlpA